MIITSPEKYKIKSVITNAPLCRHPNEPWIHQPFYVIRKATREEWAKDCIEDGVEVDPDPYPYFYEILTD